MSDTILRVDDIQKYYGNKGSLTKAVDHISFTVDRGEFLGIMGRLVPERRLCLIVFLLLIQ